MTLAIGILMAMLFVNALIAFGVAFFWQVKVIRAIYGISGWKNAFAPGKALGNPDSPQNIFGRFLAGDILPELRRKWLKAIIYVVASYAVLFLVAGLAQLIAPDHFS